MLLIFASCFFGKNEIGIKPIKAVANKKFGDEYKLIPNSNSTYIICIKEQNHKVVNPNYIMDFFIYDKTKSEIVYEDKLSNADIKWHSKFEVAITIQKGFIKDRTDTGNFIHIYDVKLKKKRLKKDNQEK